MTNRIAGVGSDGLFSAMDGDGGVSATSTGSRDFSMFQGRGAALSPLLLRTNNTTFGPGPLLGAQFDNSDPGFAGLFPSKPIYGTTPAGSPGLGWVSGEYRQEGSLISWYLNGNLVAQYTNTTVYTSGNILIGYDDTFNSLGDTNDFAIFDNISVSAIPEPSVIGLSVFAVCGGAMTAWLSRRRRA
ncbi:MAG: hypothetical protein DME25_06700 [Verrucomicrobia bacterium]|nr:MAG: hypothetical protein DME25_06700 [Verrucomicrobiota bacterium]